MTEEQRRRLHQMIVDFIDYSIDSISPRIESAQVLLKYIPNDLKNPVVIFLLNNAIIGILESLLNKLTQTVDLLNKATRDLGENDLKRTNEIKDIQRMRNTLLAHRMEVLISSSKDMEWYKKEYGSFEKTFATIAIANEQLLDEASSLAEHPKFDGMQTGGIEESPLSVECVKEFIDALKAAKIY